jgi:hypothetical protein
MKRILEFIFAALLALSLIGCPQDSWVSSDDSNDHIQTMDIRTLRISNQSSVYIWSVRWNSHEFYRFGDYEDYERWPDGYEGRGLGMGSSSVVELTDNDYYSSGGSSYVYFKFVTGSPGTTCSVRTQDLVVVDDESLEFTITNNTVVVDTSNPTSQGRPLSSFLSP